MVNSQSRVQYPRTTMELIKYILKKLPERLLKALPMTIGLGILSWFVHTYLLVVTNEGFNPSSWLGMNILNVRGRLISSTLLWTMMGAVLPMLISFFRRGGNPIKTVTSLVKMPVDIVNKSKTGGGRFLPITCFACAATLFVNGIFSGVTGALAGGIIMSSVIAFVTGRGSVFIQLFRMIFSDIQLFILKKQNLRLDNDSIFLVLGASGSVMFLVGLLKILRLPAFLYVLISYLWVVFAVLGVVLLFNNNKVPRQMLFFLCFAGSTVLLSELLHLPIFADDGGWQEAGGTLGSWLASEGAIPATLSGLPPAIGGLVGSYVSSIIGGLFEGFGPIGPLDMPPVTPPPVQPPVGPGQPPVAPPQQPQNQPQLTEDERQRLEQERIRQQEEQERIRQEFEQRRKEEMERQLEARRKAQEELARIQAEKAKRDAYIQQLCRKYNTTPDKLRDVIRSNMNENAADAKEWADYDKKLAYGEAAAKLTLVAADTAIDGLANMTGPTGRGIRAGYKIVKGAASTAAEDGFTTANVLGGAVKGGADAATDFIENPYAKAATTVAGETIGGAISGGTEGAKKGFINGVYSAGVNAATDKLAGPGYGNDMKPTTFHKDGTATVTIKSGGEWVSKTLSGKNAIVFENKKIGNQLTQSTIKGTIGTINEMVVKPALGL